MCPRRYEITIIDFTEDINMDDMHEVIDLTADSDEYLESDTDEFMDICDSYYCSCGEEITAAIAEQYEHLCEDCHWFSQLSDADWAALSELYHRFH